MDGYIPCLKYLSADPNAVDAAKVFKYWLETVVDYIETLMDLRVEESPEINKTRMIRSFLSPEIYPHVEEINDSIVSESIVTASKVLYELKQNNIYADIY